jgi:hypothetical protein
MSSPIVTFEGYSGLMGALLRSIANGGNNSKIRLFSNNYFPTQSSTWSDFVEASFSGYSAIPMPSVLNEGLNPNELDVWDFAQVQFVMTAAPSQVVYGYWIDFIDPNTLLRCSLWCQRFDSPFVFYGAGAKLPVILTPGFSQGD